MDIHIIIPETLFYILTIQPQHTLLKKIQKEKFKEALLNIIFIKMTTERLVTTGRISTTSNHCVLWPHLRHYFEFSWGGLGRATKYLRLASVFDEI
jgi:hypothetical protein